MNLDQNISQYIQFLTLAIIPYIFAITIHEASHGYAAYMLGDDTAKNMGRLTLNPIKHLDILGLIVLILTKMIGWAKPMPFDYNIVSRKKYGLAFIAISGPLSNMFLALISSFLMYGSIKAAILIVTNFDVSFPSETVLMPVVAMLNISIKINLVLAVFNILPIPPLDGSKVLINLLPKKTALKIMKLERYGFIIILLLVAFNIITPIISYTVNILYTFVTSPIKGVFGV